VNPLFIKQDYGALYIGTEEKTDQFDYCFMVHIDALFGLERHPERGENGRTPVCLLTLFPENLLPNRQNHLFLP
jgi:hypothetical protein